jgi:hypothetical protein
MSDALILLNSKDNVAVCRRPVTAGERLDLEGRGFSAASNVDIGHKIACEPIAAGADIVKYGMAIGSATAPIAPGEWVHVHNMRSNYIETHAWPNTGKES